MLPGLVASRSTAIVYCQWLIAEGLRASAVAPACFPRETIPRMLTVVGKRGPHMHAMSDHTSVGVVLSTGYHFPISCPPHLKLGLGCQNVIGSGDRASLMRQHYSEKELCKSSSEL